ncbi:DUF4304 domain-containing protein [Marinobacter confluentis]|uniref:DUF4304 domain-containing protein n=2 Tax=Marinobacter confluentis TaxID=1697557 RepID=A0A4Z1BYE1_9GAMM|nr:DUF4304 domain-containing protein [Marinobacter confluentis]TGN39540.1 DUF4304 domain-containing protein [Marinobacter confluentis]
MAQHPARSAMEASLKAIVVPELRSRGFKGSYPHFRRIMENRIDLLTFQFYSAGGSFVVEIGNCGPEGTRFSGPNKAKVSEIGNRLRLGAERPGRDHWFEFGLPNYQPGNEVVHPKSHYDTISAEVANLIETQGEAFWSGAA